MGPVYMCVMSNWKHVNVSLSVKAIVNCIWGKPAPNSSPSPFVVWRTFWISPNQLNIRRIHCSVLNQEHTLMGMFLFTAPNWAASSLLTFLLHTNLAEYLSFPVSLYICHPMCWSWMRTEKEEEWVCRGGITSSDSKNKKKVLFTNASY